MKKLGKLSINPSKMMGNEELVSLRGGYYNNAYAYCAGSDGQPIISGSFDAGCGCDQAKLDRWITSNCWPEHYSTSSVECHPCV
jgi:hypothetical protein